jgi:hypothetical protein
VWLPDVVIGGRKLSIKVWIAIRLIHSFLVLTTNKNDQFVDKFGLEFDEQGAWVGSVMAAPLGAKLDSVFCYCNSPDTG